MTDVTFNVGTFRDQFPEFASPADYPESVLQVYFDTAACYVSAENYGRLSGDCRLLALNAMTAHLCKLNSLVTSGEAAGVATSATIGSVSVSLTPPPFGDDQWSYWLSTTVYGIQLQALLASASVGGFYVGGAAERSAFRGLGGRFAGRSF